MYCFLFFFVSLLVYIRARERGEYLRGWNLVAFIASFICCLNSKEMGAALAPILIVYELLFHTPHWRSAADAGRWLIHEGRGALLASVCLIGYIPAKTSAQGLARTPAYVSTFTWSTFLHDTGVYLGYLTYSSHPFTFRRRHHLLRLAWVLSLVTAFPSYVVRAAIFPNHIAAGLIRQCARRFCSVYAECRPGSLYRRIAGMDQGQIG